MTKPKMEAVTVWDNAAEFIRTVRWGTITWLEWCQREANRMTRNGIRAEVRRSNKTCAVYRVP